MVFQQLLGVDIGGSHITAAVMDRKTCLPLLGSRAREHVNAHGTAAQVIEEWAKVLQVLCQGDANVRIGISMPGPFDYEAGISYIKGLNKYEALYGCNVKALLADALGITPGQIRMMNDADAFLAGEMAAGAGKGYKHAAGITLGTGLGSAISKDGKVEGAGLYCMPYREATAEAYLCTNWFIQRYKELGGAACGGVKELAQRMPADAFAAEVFKEFACNLGEVLVYRFGSDAPEAVIVGGNVAKAWQWFIDPVEAFTSSQRFDVKFLPAELGEDAAMIGAARLWEEVF